ncbi:MAG: Fasciclin domain protein [Bacteroidetes bacterium ADurb.Bin123]|nr:MAG: Fasciclin domain protein [Bacteroidetes bacterium ADurb.Bin123]
MSAMEKNRLIILFLVSLLLGTCTDAWEEHTRINDNVSQETILDYLEAHSEFSQFTGLLKSVGMEGNFSYPGLFTLYAPTNSAMEKVSAGMIDSDEKKKLFVRNHYLNGVYSVSSDKEKMFLTMKSGKVLEYDPLNKTIGGMGIDASIEAVVSNGNIQVIDEPLVPKFHIWDFIELEAPRNEFVRFLNSLTSQVFDTQNSVQTGIDSQNRPVYDTVWVKQNLFLKNIADLSSEDSLFTMLLISDDVFMDQFAKFERSYRVDDKISNAIPTQRDSMNIKMMIARDLVFRGKHPLQGSPDTLVSYFGVKVPFVKPAVTSSYQASNGYVYTVSDCNVKREHKILPILMEAEDWIYSYRGTSGTPHPYFRERENASGGSDFILDNSHGSQKLTGALFKGPLVSSIKYRVKIRAINDFRKSYRVPDESVELRQFLGQVSITRNPVTNMITNISSVTNAFRTDTLYGRPDFFYDPADVNTYYVPITKTRYAPLENAADDELDLGYYDFSRSDSVFFRLVPFAGGMAVTADYFRLVPIFE